MPKCSNCGKQSFFLSVDSNGLCKKCSLTAETSTAYNEQNQSVPDDVLKLNMNAGYFFDTVTTEYLVIAKRNNYINGKPHFITEVYNAGNHFTYAWLCDDELAKACETTVQAWHNIAIDALFGGAFYAYAWLDNKEIFDADRLYAIFRISDRSALGTRYLPYSINDMINLASELFNKMLSLLDKMNLQSEGHIYNNIHKGLWAIFCIGAAIQLENSNKIPYRHVVS